MIQKIKSYIESNHLLTTEKFVIVGISGGSDSVSLLFILNHLGYNCIAAHCNFHLRANESNRDESFCRDFAEQHTILFEKKDFDTKAYCIKHHISFEMAARNLRYEWFEYLRQKYNAQAIAVGHHLDDSNETILLNMIRGTGIRGLCGIRPKNGWVVRPLLCVNKDDIDRFINKHALTFVTDSSNKSDSYMRNIIRLRLIPLMKEINPSIKSALSRTATNLYDIEQLYFQTIENAKKTLLIKTGNDDYRISINDLSKFPSPKTILYELLLPFGFSCYQASAIYNSLSGESGKIFNTSNTDYQLLKDRTWLFVYKKTVNYAETYQIEENETNLAHLPIQLSVQKVEINPSFQIDNSLFTATIDFEKIHFPLILRKWRNGDWFIPFGMNGRKKVSDYFTNRKFSLKEKNNIWLLCNENNIIWIIGERIDNRYRINNQTKIALVINFFKKNDCFLIK